LQQTDYKMVSYNLLKYQPIFKGLSEASLRLLAFELCVVRNYRPGDLICKQSKRSASNRLFEHWYNKKNNLMSSKVKLLREEADALG